MAQKKQELQAQNLELKAKKQKINYTRNMEDMQLWNNPIKVNIDQQVQQRYHHQQQISMFAPQQQQQRQQYVVDPNTGKATNLVDGKHDKTQNVKGHCPVGGCKQLGLFGPIQTVSVNQATNLVDGKHDKTQNVKGHCPELKFKNEFLKSYFQDLKDIYAYSAGSSVQEKEVDNDSKELKDKIEALNEELVIERQIRGAAEATIEHLLGEYTKADAKSHELEAKLAEAQKNLEQQVKERDEKDSELDSELNRLHKRAKQQVQEVQKKDDLEAKYKEVNEKSEQAASRLSGLQQKLDRTRQHANEALKAIDTERQQL
uniref:Protein GRIP n=1 Tax=Tanacetum cinerariifolium TaxID=118510 RepID=A0A6L2N977_TANCI|nr:protein GRIP [Tanacetum cinerariifolium]